MTAAARASTTTSTVESTSRGKVTRVEDGLVVFQPAGTNYELHLRTPVGRYDGPVNTPVSAIIRVQGRKVYSVPSGGAFITPIFGSPRIVQGRVRQAEAGRLLVHAAGAMFHVDLPGADHAIDLNAGPIQPGQMVNVVVLPGATFELAGS